MADGTDEPTKPIENNTPPTTPTTTTPPETTPPAAPKTFDESYVKDLRAEAAKHRKEASAAKTRLQELETAQMAAETAELEAQGQWKTLAEQNAAKTAELEAQLLDRDATIKAERLNALAVAIATGLGAIDPTDPNIKSVTTALDIASSAAMSITDDDADAQIRKALEALKVARPYLFGTPKPSLAPFNPGGDPQVPATETREQRRKRLQGSGESKFFDVPTIEARGGGVGWGGKTKSE